MKNKIFSAWLRFAHRVIFAWQLTFPVFLLNLIGNKKKVNDDLAILGTCAPGTLGRAVWDMMQANHLDFVPWYVNHDLKHALLGYPQQAPDEMRMQAFMFGNAGFSCFYVFIFLAFVIWTPDAWSSLPYHYRCGRLTKPIGHWRIEAFAHRDLEALRLEIGLEVAREQARLIKNDQKRGVLLSKLKPIKFLKTFGMYTNLLLLF
jgi:hypothetical protein